MVTSTPTDLVPDPDASPESMVVRVSSGERIHYLDWGATAEVDRPGGSTTDPRPVVVLVHGIAATGWSWAPVARRLTRVARVLAPDLRGHGLSEGARSALDLSSLAWDVLTVVAANGAGSEVGGSPAILAGHGLGAMVVAEAARLQPASVAGLVLVDGGWEDVGAATRMSAEELSAALAEPPEVLASMEAFLEDRRDFDPATWDEDQDRAARAQVERKHAGHVALITRPATLRTLAGTMLGYEPRETLAAVPAPVTVLVAGAGTADDEAAHDRAVALREVVAARDSAGAPPTQVRTLPGTGHNLMRYRPDAVVGAIADLLGTAAR